MRGYPKHVATKQDFLNLLAMPEYKARALADLEYIRDLNDYTTTVAIRQRCTELFTIATESAGLDTGAVNEDLKAKLEAYLGSVLPAPRITQKSATNWELALVPMERLDLVDDHGTVRAYRADSEDEWETEVIDNPMPLWKQKGFVSREEVAALIAAQKQEAK